MTTLSVAISPCPNDTFIFGAWILGHAPALPAWTADFCGMTCRNSIKARWTMPGM